MSDKTGIYRHGAGWKAVVSRGRYDAPLVRQFPAETPLREMQDWRRDQQAVMRLKRRVRASRGMFHHDAARYLKTIAALPTLVDRTREINCWITVFGDKQRDRITSAEIRAARDRWLTEPRNDEDSRPLAPATVNKRLRALSNLYRVLDGAEAANPVRQVPEAVEPFPVPRALPYPTIRALLDALPNQTRADKGKKRGTVSKTKLRLTCLAYCSLTPGQLMALTAADVDLARGRVKLPDRRKGKGVAGLWFPLVPDGIEAFRAFDAHGCYGRFSLASMRKSLKTAAKKIGLTRSVRVYDFRHSYGTLVYSATQNLASTGKLLQQRSAKTTERYVMEADAQVISAVTALVGDKLAQS